MPQVKIKCEICGQSGSVDDRVVAGEVDNKTWQAVWRADENGKRTIMVHHKCLMDKMIDNL